MNVLCAAPQPVRPSPVPLAAGGHRRLNSWRLHAASLFAPDAQVRLGAAWCHAVAS